MDRKKEARGEILGWGERIKAEKAGSKETLGSYARKTKVADQNRGPIENFEAWIPTLPKEQKNNQTRRQEKLLGSSQDKSKLSHSNDWCAKTGSNTIPL